MAQQHSEKLSYLSGKLVETIYDEELLSLWNNTEAHVQSTFLKSVLIGREEKIGILEEDFAKAIKKCIDDDRDKYYIDKLEDSFFGGRLESTGIMREYDENCSSYVETLKTVNETKEDAVQEEPLDNAFNWIGDTINNYLTGLFPIYPYAPEKVQFLVNGTYYGDQFIGLRISADGCISFVDAIDSFLNALCYTETISGIIKALASLLPKYLGGTILYCTSIALYLRSIFASLWSNVCSFLSTSPIGIAISLVLTFFATAAILTLVNIFICGCLQIDYICGFVIHNGWFNIESFCTNPLDPNNTPIRIPFC